MSKIIFLKAFFRNREDASPIRIRDTTSSFVVDTDNESRLMPSEGFCVDLLRVYPESEGEIRITNLKSTRTHSLNAYLVNVTQYKHQYYDTI